jgi:hypothetical protein
MDLQSPKLWEINLLFHHPVYGFCCTVVLTTVDCVGIGGKKRVWEYYLRLGAPSRKMSKWPKGDEENHIMEKVLPCHSSYMYVMLYISLALCRHPAWLQPSWSWPPFCPTCDPTTHLKLWKEQSHWDSQLSIFCHAWIVLSWHMTYEYFSEKIPVHSGWLPFTCV